jgi:hypothetical protein
MHELILVQRLYFTLCMEFIYLLFTSLDGYHTN